MSGTRLVAVAIFIMATAGGVASAAGLPKTGGPGGLAQVLRLHFEANTGQDASTAAFIGRVGSRTLLIGPAYIGVLPASTLTSGHPGNPLQLQFLGANRHGSFEPLDELPTRANYFRGDRKQWRTGVREFARLRYRALYPNIDLVLHSDLSGNALEYDFEVLPHADVSAIVVRFAGIRNLQLDGNGELVIETPTGRLRQRRPVAYQSIDGARVAVSARYEVMAANTARIRLGNYRKDLPLTIDPALIYSTVLNGSTSDDGSDATASAVYMDSTGHVYTYVGGITNSGPAQPITDFPIKNAYRSQPGVGFIAKLDNGQAGDASAIYVTYFDGAIAIGGMATDAAGNLYVVGSSYSTSLPIVNGYTQTGQAFLVKFSSDGSAILYSTRAGGSAYFSPCGGCDPGSWFSAIAVDGSGNAYVVGGTHSGDLPQVNALQTYHANNGSNAFVQIVNTNAAGAASLAYSTYFSGSNAPRAPWGYSVSTTLGAVAVDATSRIYVGGSSSDPTFPIVNGFSSTLQSASASLLAVLDPSKSGSAQTVYSTFIGATERGDEFRGGISGLAVDTSGNVYATGSTTAGDLPTTSAAYQPHNGGANAFIVKINPTFSGPASLLSATYLGGTGGRSAPDGASAIALDSSGNVLVAGNAGSGDFPLLNPAVPAANGLLQSLDHGNTWNIVNSKPHAAGAFYNGVGWSGALAIDATTSPRTLYVGTGGGVLKSSDGGLNWSPANSGLGNLAIGALILDSANPSNLYAATGGGIFRSVDTANTWTEFDNQLPSAVAAAATSTGATLVLDGGTLYLAAGGLFKTSTAQNAWIQLFPGGPGGFPSVAGVAVDPKTSPHTIYFPDGISGSLWKSTDGGTTWALTGPGMDYLPASVAVDTSTTPSTVWAYDYFGLWKSSDGGATWAESLPWCFECYVFFAFDASTSPSTIYVSSGTAGGPLYVSPDGGNNWNIALTGNYNAVAVDPFSSGGNPPPVYTFSSSPTPTAFVAELDSSLSTLKFSTLLGAVGGPTGANTLSVDGSGNMYLAGGTQSPFFPLLNAYNSYLGNSAFLSVLGAPTLPASSSGPVATTVGTATGSLSITMPDITGSTTGSSPTLSVTPLTTTTAANFSLSDNLGAYDISTTATYAASPSQPITLCFQALTVNDVATFNGLTIMHVVNGTPLNITTSWNFPTRTICGTTTSLSPFVLVKGVVSQIGDLIRVVNALDLRKGITTSLDSKLQNASSAYSSAASHDYAAVCNMMSAFISSVQAQTGQSLTSAEATKLISAAKQIKATAGCGQ
jgi:photosystem II stability/assembly factor-like uncharacterized protein